MYELIAIFLPGIIATEFYQYFLKTELPIRKFIERYVEFLLIPNLIIFSLYLILKNNTDQFIFTIETFVRYSVLNLVVSIIYATFHRIIVKNIELSIEVEKNEN